MTATSEQPDANRPASLGVLGVLLAGSVGVAYIAGLWLGGRLSPGQVGQSAGALWGAFSVAFGAMVGVLMLAPPSVREARKLGVGVLISSGVRLIFMLAMAVVVLMMMKPAATALFGAVGVGGALCIFFESAWAMRFLKRFSQARSGALLV